MDFTPSLNAKGFFRFTGPPENWLTGIKFMTWGLNKKMSTDGKKYKRVIFSLFIARDRRFLTLTMQDQEL